MTNLLTGFGDDVERRWLPDPDRAEATFTTEFLPGVRVHALGPSHDDEVISTLDPPEGEYYEYVSSPVDPATRREPIFGNEHVLSKNEYRRRVASRHLYTEVAFDELQARAELDTGLAAQTLEDMINGTSLVLILEVGNAVLVLGGDAEYGTWSQVLKDSQWTSLLARTTLYKVSHHGSYNGTPKRYVEEHMPPDAVSLVSLTPMERWPSIPRQSLLEALDIGERRLIRTDQPADVGGVVTEVTDLYTDVSIEI